MSVGFPRFRLYESNGVVLVYEFENVLNWDPDPFQDPKAFVEQTNLRSQGSIILDGGLESWDIQLEFYLSADGYENLVSLISSLPITIEHNTNYVLKIDITSGGSTKDLKVKRLTPIQFPITTEKKVTQSQRGFVTFRIGTWI